MRSGMQGSLVTSRAWVEVNLDALRHNIALCRQQLSPQASIWAVVKANAYGHGAVLTSLALVEAGVEAGVEGLCVATLSEGIELRTAGLSCPILILGALNTLVEWQTAVFHRLEPTLTHPAQIPLAIQSAAQRPTPLHLNVDTGMTRLGIPWQQAGEVWAMLINHPALDCRSLYSHLATADEVDPTVMRLQQTRFQQVIDDLHRLGRGIPVLHLDNSAGLLTLPAGHFQRVRLGLVLYGIPPADHLRQHLAPPALQPVLTIKARITHLQWAEPGTGVSYGHRHVCAHRTHVATVGIGYADGIPRRLSGWIQASVRGQVIRQIGTITMDQCMWDVTDISSVQIGDEVRLLAPPQGVEAWAEQLGTIPYEILCGLSARLPRLGVD
ncbi:MAG: alanine racemase [Synechococcaceae cyanobacterium SM2_3_2]|nr:alanine racemase [Synechococcaceae cyanobacterium SM2_3_2]